jgi:hypothetical protein
MPLAPRRRRFWTCLHPRLPNLDSWAQGPILAAIHARIPVPTKDDQRAVLAGGVEVGRASRREGDSARRSSARPGGGWA